MCGVKRIRFCSTLARNHSTSYTNNYVWAKQKKIKVLGCVYDTQLLMHVAARTVATEAGWRLKNLLSCRRFFSVPELLRLYKAQILSYIESSTAGLYHAAPSTLEKIDRIQRRFLLEFGISEREALCDFRLAPLRARRDVAMLGALRKLNLGLAPKQFQELFAIIGKRDEPLLRQRLRWWRPLHTKQLGTPATNASSDVLKRSAFGLAHCCNYLPQTVVNKSSVKSFQRVLQIALSKLAAANTEEWQSFYSIGWRRYPRAKFDRFF